MRARSVCDPFGRLPASIPRPGGTGELFDLGHGPGVGRDDQR
ncbi:hypothetical protein [Nocardioides sp. T2.26MG-1]|nr:hypothetical protein [Nocardioides sp. T2.26MG-1]